MRDTVGNRVNPCTVDIAHIFFYPESKLEMSCAEDLRREYLLPDAELPLRSIEQGYRHNGETREHPCHESRACCGRSGFFPAAAHAQDACPDIAATGPGVIGSGDKAVTRSMGQSISSISR